MVVDVGFSGTKRAARPIASSPKPYAVNLSGEAKRQHEKAMEIRRRLAKTSSDLESAMSSLAVANSEIDRLNEKISQLEDELIAEREKSARLAKSSRKGKKDKGSSSPEC